MIHQSIRPHEIFNGKLLFIAPHMDDEVLAAGGLIAGFPRKEDIHLVYATKAMQSSATFTPGSAFPTPGLDAVRIQESTDAMSLFGINTQNLHFLGLPEGTLSQDIQRLKRLLLKFIKKINPDHVFIPFRYDRHPDHLAINQVVTRAHQEGLISSRIVEYFVYYRYKLLPLRDIRKYIHPRLLVQVNIDGVADVKRRALDCFKSQTTVYYSWQTRPVLSRDLLDEECVNPECFLMSDPSRPKKSIFKHSALLIRIVHRVEPVLKTLKYGCERLLRVLIDRKQPAQKD